MRADAIGVVDIHVIDVFARLHLGLHLFDDIAFLDIIVFQVDAGDLAKCLGECFRFINMCVDRFRHDVDVLPLVRFRRLDEEFHLGHLIGL